MIDDITAELRRPISITWIKGHQDQASQGKTLSRDAENNIAVDALATKHRVEKLFLPRKKADHLPKMQASISINGLRIIS